MDKFDEKVIGYESTKEILRQILDILKRPETYKRPANKSQAPK